MDAPVEKPQVAWRPLTPRGVAAFAGATLGRLLLVQFFFALLAAASVVWFLHMAWFPIIQQAIRQLPAQGSIHTGKLDWRGNSPLRLAEDRFLAIAVDLKHEGEARSPAHIQIELGESDFQIIYLLGSVSRAYPLKWNIAVNRAELEPWWGAWAPELLALVAGLLLAGLMLSWALLATIYWVPVWLIGFFGNRALSLPGSWRLAGAALMPGALFLIVVILLYGLGILDPVHLLVAVALHLAIGWIYLFISALSLPLHPAAAALKKNPFAIGAAEPPKGTEEQPKG